jgi:hypothetical protein
LARDKVMIADLFGDPWLGFEGRTWNEFT